MQESGRQLFTPWLFDWFPTLTRIRRVVWLITLEIFDLKRSTNYSWKNFRTRRTTKPWTSNHSLCSPQWYILAQLLNALTFGLYRAWPFTWSRIFCVLGQHRPFQTEHSWLAVNFRSHRLQIWTHVRYTVLQPIDEVTISWLLLATGI